MTTDAGNPDRSSDRAEEVFSALSSNPKRAEPPAEEGNPWKLASLLLLLLALALPLAFGIRISRERMAFDEKVRVAAARVEEARARVSEGEPVAAVEHIYNALSAFADVENAPEAAAELRSLLRAREMDLERERSAVAKGERRAASHRRALQDLLAGTPVRAEAAIRDEGAADSVGRLIGDLAARVAQLDRIETTEGETRAVALMRLRDAWPFPALQSLERRAREEVEAAERAAGARARANRSLLSEDPAEIGAGLAGLLDAAGYAEGARLLDAWRRADLLARAAAASDDANHRAAEALFAAAGADRRAAEAHRFAVAEELKAVRMAQHEHLIRILASIAEEAEKAGSYDHAEALYFALSTLTDEEDDRLAARRNRAAHLMKTARELSRDGFYAAAAARARLTRAFGSEDGEAFAKEQEEAAVREEADRWSHLLDGARSAAEFESAPETLRAILDALGFDPAAIDEDVANARRNRAVVDALLQIDSGAVARARQTLAEVPGAADLAPVLAARVDILTGWVDEGLARLGDDEDAQVALLLGCAADVFEENPAAAGRMIAKARAISGGDIGLVPALAAMLDAASASDEAHTLWKSLKAEAASRLPKEAPELPETPDGPGDSDAMKPE